MTKERFESVSEFTDIEIYEFYVERAVQKGYNPASWETFLAVLNNPLKRFNPFHGIETLNFDRSVAYRVMIDYYKQKFNS